MNEVLNIERIKCVSTLMCEKKWIQYMYIKMG